MTNLFERGDFMRKQFSELDRDGDGFITEADLKALIKGHPRYDQNGDKKISFEEYRNGLLAYLFQNLQNEDMARSLFRLLDADKSGAVSVKELYNFFEGCIGTLPREYVEGFLERLDSNRDGEINSNAVMFSRLRRRHDVGRRERLVELFNRMDCNGDRILHMNEVNEYLQRHRYDPSAIRVGSTICASNYRTEMNL
ncbi:unnamed protein product [Hydatigera taeniaeformis]|uniref:Calmodulin n=1 Tax=Hydatigena taeniaeformis TaxID=6205 RepID=A0A0R3WQ28_HYDTA|nr:unnamed protein product [Hydatigera taeniaeformis]